MNINSVKLENGIIVTVQDIIEFKDGAGTAVANVLRFTRINREMVIVVSGGFTITEEQFLKNITTNQQS